MRPMAKRSAYDWLREEANKEHWLTAETVTGNILESAYIPARSDLKRVLIEALARWSSDGWTIESFSSQSNNFFCNKDGERRFVHIRPTDPSKLHPLRR